MDFGQLQSMDIGTIGTTGPNVREHVELVYRFNLEFVTIHAHNTVENTAWGIDGDIGRAIPTIATMPQLIFDNCNAPNMTIHPFKIGTTNGFHSLKVVNFINWEGNSFSLGKKVPPCALACKPDNNAWYSELAPQVIDGTRCYDDGEVLDVCIRGKCHVGIR